MWQIDDRQRELELELKRGGTAAIFDIALALGESVAMRIGEEASQIVGVHAAADGGEIRAHARFDRRLAGGLMTRDTAEFAQEHEPLHALRERGCGEAGYDGRRSHSYRRTFGATLQPDEAPGERTCGQDPT